MRCQNSKVAHQILGPWAKNDWKPLIYDHLVISETRTTSNKPEETIKQWVIRFSHKSLHCLRQNLISTHCDLILSCRLSNSSTKPSKYNFQLVLFQLKVEHCYSIFHWSWNFWEMFTLISFLKNSRMKRWWREELQQIQYPFANYSKSSSDRNVWPFGSKKSWNSVKNLSQTGP